MSTVTLPNWAEQLLERLRQMEISLGNLHPENTGWSATKLDSLYQRLHTDDGADEHELDDGEPDAVFAQIARGLAREGYVAEQISEAINARMTGNSRLAYCNAQEVQAAIYPA